MSIVTMAGPDAALSEPQAPAPIILPRLARNDVESSPPQSPRARKGEPKIGATPAEPRSFRQSLRDLAAVVTGITPDPDPKPVVHRRPERFFD